MAENTEKTEKIQLEGIIEKDKVLISNKEGFEEFYKNSYIGTIEKDTDGNGVSDSATGFRSRPKSIRIRLDVSV